MCNSFIHFIHSLQPSSQIKENRHIDNIQGNRFFIQIPLNVSLKLSKKNFSINSTDDKVHTKLQYNERQ